MKRADAVPLIAAPGDEAMLRARWPDLPVAAVVVDDRTAVCDALYAGAGAGVLPGFLGEGPRDAGLLVRLHEEPLTTVKVHAVFLPEQRKDARVRTLIELIEAEIQRGLGR